MKITRDEHATCTCIYIWIEILQHSRISYIFECYHFCLTRFALVFMIFFWTSSHFFIHIGERRLCYCIKRISQIRCNCLLCFLNVEPWQWPAKKSALLRILIMSSELENYLYSHWSYPILTHHCYSLPYVYILTFTTVITSQHGLRLITVTGIWICITLSCVFLRWMCIQIAYANTWLDHDDMPVGLYCALLAPQLKANLRSTSVQVMNTWLLG